MYGVCVVLWSCSRLQQCLETVAGLVGCSSTAEVGHFRQRSFEPLQPCSTQHRTRLAHTVVKHVNKHSYSFTGIHKVAKMCAAIEALNACDVISKLLYSHQFSALSLQYNPFQLFRNILQTPSYSILLASSRHLPKPFLKPSSLKPTSPRHICLRSRKDIPIAPLTPTTTSHIPQHLHL